MINGAGSVFATPAAREWLRLLEALERPASPPRARAATMTSFLGWSAERVASAGEDEWEEVHRRLHTWAAVLRRRGLASLTETITLVERIPGRVLGVVDGERRLTDLRHVGQLLHGAASSEKLGTAALAVWLRQRIATARDRGRRGALPPPGVRRRGRPGPDDPPLQGPRVPGRLRPVPVGADVGRRQADADRLPRPQRRVPPHDRRRPERRRLQAPQGLAHRGAARRGPAARLRGVDARQAPGRDLVGGVLELQGLRAVAPAVRPRRRGQRRRRAARARRPTTPRSPASASWRVRPRAASASSRPAASGSRWPGPARCASPPRCRRRSSTARSTATGAARPTAT